MPAAKRTGWRHCVAKPAYKVPSVQRVPQARWVLKVPLVQKVQVVRSVQKALRVVAHAA